ncbi:hypothetical protein GCM10011506_39270 [Marivirga lumbricoides]|uniref:Secretion system C-terminal sorting domain-containing protein n=1 Tax=Marivirga lumbricoides TaxID=1046115 RepID=A0ABQ1N6F1_9BACT|nr:hypothetical protein GCM10011506_39270 [Marivirga lumbricoides]
MISNLALAQNYTSAGNGNWELTSNWTNTSGNGAATPSLNGGYGTRNLNHNQTITGNYTLGSATLNISTDRTLIVTGNFENGGGGQTNLQGTLIVEGNITLNSRINVLPGGRLIAKNNLRINSSDYLNVGTNVAPPAFADLIVYGNLNAFNSGDVIINRNGRVAVFGDVNDNGGGGTILRVNNGGQMYVDGDINYAGGGSTIQNNNTTNPYGLYVNGDINNTGGGSNTTPNTADQQTLLDTNPDFANWLGGIENGPLPIELISFMAKSSDNIIQLNWITAKEENFSHFELERSVDQQKFEIIGIIQGQGESFSDVHYDFEDSDAPYGKIFYKLKAVDIDDTFEYSPVISVENNFKGKISIYPNPVKQPSHVKLMVPGLFTENISHMALFDMEGSLLKEFINFNPADELTIDEIKAGIYLLKVDHNGLEENIRLIIK